MTTECAVNTLEVFTYTLSEGDSFFISRLSIQNCRSSEKTGRKEIILRFFSPRDLAKKKESRGVKSRDLIPSGCVFFQPLGLRDRIWLTIFFSNQNPEGIKTRKIDR